MTRWSFLYQSRVDHSKWKPRDFITALRRRMIKPTSSSSPFNCLITCDLLINLLTWGALNNLLIIIIIVIKLQRQREIDSHTAWKPVIIIWAPQVRLSLIASQCISSFKRSIEETWNLDLGSWPPHLNSGQLQGCMSPYLESRNFTMSHSLLAEIYSMFRNLIIFLF